MPIDFDEFIKGRVMSPDEAYVRPPAKPKVNNKGKPMEGTMFDTKNIRWKPKCQGKCLLCLLWDRRHGDSVDDIRPCLKRDIKTAGWMGCQGYYRSRY